MREALAICVLATVCVVMIGAAIMGPVRGSDVYIYAMPKVVSAVEQASGIQQAPAMPAHIHWDAPDAWRKTEAISMSFATLLAPLSDGGTAACSFSVVSSGPGMLEDNVKRWLGQVGLPPGAATKPVMVESTLGPVQLWHFANPAMPDRAFLIGVMVFSDRMLTVKLVAPVAELANLEPAFSGLLRTLRGDDGVH